MTHDHYAIPESIAPIERLARRRASAKLGWYMHAGVFLGINVLLWLLSSVAGKPWALFPTLGWGLGLALHGLVVFACTGGWYEQLLQAERNRLASRNASSTTP
jgi:hypothetical protein